MKHANLLIETISILSTNGKVVDDVLWVGDENHYMSWLEFSSKANRIYHNDRGTKEVNAHLKVAGKDFWLERNVRNGHEFWEYKALPKKPVWGSGLILFERDED